MADASIEVSARKILCGVLMAINTRRPPRAGLGRPLGSKNRVSGLLRERLAGSPGDPVEVLLALQHDRNKLVRLAAARALLPYVYPRLSVVELLDGLPLPPLEIKILPRA